MKNRASKHSVWLLMALLLGCSKPQPAATVEVKPESHEGHGGAGHEGHAMPGAAAPASVSTTKSFGAPIDNAVTVAKLSDLAATPDQFKEKPFRVEGQVVAVCQEMGCWMEIKDSQTQAHIKMHGHSFFVPRDLNGRRAAVQATLVKAAVHNSHCDREAQEATGRVADLELDATGVQVLD